MNHNYIMRVYDASGSRLTYTTSITDPVSAVMEASEWAINGGLDLDWVEVVEATDPEWNPEGDYDVRL